MKFKIVACSLIMFSNFAAALSMVPADPRAQARKLYFSLTGVTPSTRELDLLEVKMESNKNEAALDIIDQRNEIKNGGAFYTVTVKDMVTPWTNKDGSTLSPLNDMSATIIGWIRDNKQFNQILYTDSVYKAAGVTFKGELKYFPKNQYPGTIANAQQLCDRDIPAADRADRTKSFWIIHNDPFNPNDRNAKKCMATKYNETQLNGFYALDALLLPHLDLVIETNLIASTNAHFESISALGLDLGDPRLLNHSSQEVKLHAYPQAISGLMTTRAYGAAYVIAGTNRAPVAFAMKNFLCKDMEELNDTTIPDLRNRRDVDRSPGGTSATYKTRCIGCHAGMDGLAGAYAYYDYTTEKLIYKPGVVSTKMNHNVVFNEGFVTQSDQWINLWVEGQNASLGWGQTTVGEGVKSLAVMLSETEAFHSCMAKQVYEKVCFRKVSTVWDKTRVKNLTSSYKSDSFNMKNLFINASLSCLGD
ncbi:MAG TPA: hypothetical protein VNJ01_09845 [Bacteriovoracaceae bacterium]|nr:hypothetical protein [Bacteriovoracaceae bacterium]